MVTMYAGEKLYPANTCGEGGLTDDEVGGASASEADDTMHIALSTIDEDSAVTPEAMGRVPVFSSRTVCSTSWTIYISKCCISEYTMPELLHISTKYKNVKQERKWKCFDLYKVFLTH